MIRLAIIRNTVLSEFGLSPISLGTERWLSCESDCLHSVDCSYSQLRTLPMA